MEIQCTTEYELFKFHSQQRKLDPDHVKKLTKSMKERGYIMSDPVIVNAEFEIVDGQHRFQAAKNLGIPFSFTQDNNITVDDIREMAKTTEKWTMGDFVTSHLRQHKPDYVKLNELKEQSGLAWNPFIDACFGDRVIVKEEIRNGKFILTERRVEGVKTFLDRFNLFRNTFGGWNHSNFTLACAHVFSHPEYNHERMKGKLEYCVQKLHRCTTAQEYVDMLSDIYNFKAQGPSHITFGKRKKYTP